MRALISVSDNTGVVEFAHALMSEYDAIIVSTGGTFEEIKASAPTGKLFKVSDLTGFPEIMDGRVKMLHPKIFAGILARHSNRDDLAEIDWLGCPPMDIVVVNLCLFAKTALKDGVTFDELVEEIDIGRPALIRAAAKNFRDVVVVVDPEDYSGVLQRLHDWSLNLDFRFRLALKALGHTATYDRQIADELVRWEPDQSGSFVVTAADY